MNKKIDIPYLAKLARLHIRDDELDGFVQDMQAMIEMVDTLPVEAQTLPPQGTESTQLRQDIAVFGAYATAELMKNAPQTQSDCIVVPRTVE